MHEVPGEYADFYDYIKGGWFPMKLATVAAGLVALRFFRFPFLTAPVAFALWFIVHGPHAAYLRQLLIRGAGLSDGIARLRARRACWGVPGG